MLTIQSNFIAEAIILKLDTFIISQLLKVLSIMKIFFANNHNFFSSADNLSTDLDLKQRLVFF